MRVLGCIIAGGKSTRMGQDKAFMLWRGQALIAHVAERMAPQVEALVVNANGGRIASGLDSARPLFRRFAPPSPAGGEGVTIIRDVLPLETPLAGVHAALSYAAAHGFDAVLTSPCDTPLLPGDLRMRLEGEGAAIASSGGQAHYLHGLWPVAALAKLEGLRRLQDFARACDARQVEWSIAGFDPFANINTPEDLLKY